MTCGRLWVIAELVLVAAADAPAEPPGAPRPSPIRAVRATPPRTTDWGPWVTSAGTLVVGERVESFDDGSEATSSCGAR